MANKSIISILKNPNDEDTNLHSFIDLNNYNIGIFQIPIYQRKYSWESEKINDFLNEIETLFESEFLDKITNDLAVGKKEYTADRDFKFNEPVILPEKNIFFGIIYLTKAKKEIRDVIDGQQRISTWYLFLLVSYKLLDSYKNKYKNTDSQYKKEYNIFFYEYLRRWLFTNWNDKDFEPQYKNFRYKTQQKDDEEEFKNLFIHFFKGNNILFDKNSKVYNAVVEIEKFLLKQIEKLNQQKVILNHKFFLSSTGIYSEKYHKTFVVIFWLIWNIIPNLKFGIFELKNENYASEIFETINGKGLQLTSFDIIKNKLYKNYTEDYEFRANFLEIEEKIKKCYKDLKHADNFLLDFFKACYIDQFKTINDVKKKKIVSNFLEIVKFNQEKAKEFISKANAYLDWYIDLFVIRSYKNSSCDVNKITLGLNLLGFKSIKPILISMLLINTNQNKIYQIFNFIEKLYKYFLLKLNVDKEQANFMENTFKKIMLVGLKFGLSFLDPNVVNNNDPDFKSVLNLIKEMNFYFFDQENLCKKIVDKIKYEPDVAKWFLYNIMNFNQEKEHLSLEGIHLEHVLPKNNTKWIQECNFWKYSENNQDIENYIYQLGNCTLMLDKINQTISNKIFSEKYERILNKIKDIDSAWIDRERNTFKNYNIIELGKSKKNWDKHVIETRNKIIKERIKEIKLFNFN